MLNVLCKIVIATDLFQYFKIDSMKTLLYRARALSSVRSVGNAHGVLREICVQMVVAANDGLQGSALFAVEHRHRYRHQLLSQVSKRRAGP